MTPTDIRARMTEKVARALELARDAINQHSFDVSLPSDGDLDDLERDRYEGLRAACEAYHTHLLTALGLSDGSHVVVPVEPSVAMLDAAWHATRTATAAQRMWTELGTTREAHDIKMRRRFAAMLKASESSDA